MRHFRSVNIVFLLLFLVGCAANVKEEVHKPFLEPRDSTVNTIYLDISHPRHVPNSTDLAQIIAELKQQIRREYFGVVQGSNIRQTKPEVGTGLYISIEHYKYVSSVERFMIGLLAGKAELRLIVKHVDLASGELIVSQF